MDQPQAQAMPSRRRVGRRTVEEMVDYYNVTGPCREPLIHYVRVRSASLDYASVDGLARSLVGLFFADILKRHPDQASFACADQGGWRRGAVHPHDFRRISA